MNIFIQIKNSIYNKEYYKTTVLEEPLRQSIKYLAKLSLLIAFLLSVIFLASMPFMIKAIKTNLTSFTETGYPDGLVVSIKNGSASVNQPEPYFIKVPDSIKSDLSSSSTKIENLMVINTSEPFSLDKFKEYATFSYLTKNEVVMMGENNEIKIISLSKFGNADITKPWILEKQALLYKLLPVILIFLVLMAFIFIFIFEFIGSLVILLLYALVVWGLMSIKGIKLTYGRSYQIAIHAITLVVFIGLIGQFIKPLNNFFVKLLILIIIVYLNFEKVSTLIKTEEQTVIREGEGPTA
ncbi:MAG: hypothetical protein UR85_C0001G0013 [Candidatus Nomurabacteria bacterium GW2011_GWF2_35_66]|uniref:DUF1189 domain-containing protein n=1 Tax=Candidatus Nomurabacteria bacterium GW2011_GWE1_35_16 TaxID=1618761 RepID=A0A0G0BB81_9BACT|nr:MAG: hypothetical protein UR55_C0003G0018 [Candidatus Nomurabacteria bacterium GW2011_GWF1_34_20]KKP63526.1 MAG: hypothetical protein UR57_C0003G0013 [Candidatus Nomurabacteria bacterium GW2011_GWE2_34_25]KKP66718.1 MAG: hypothetical protein UR64_C0003G0011 [Candidatus Nomurabacteria bacterium GW2011_GWE1_35_16]KKP83818.1 MAG: hypothetical protein UR85_C0001G0013 [Candidatus Nomurabacteria bacterium GW2011_GWF2_35_66]HAE36392.1 hypothetical protein [Candidatus Nomurabacteria bacterium]